MKKSRIQLRICRDQLLTKCKMLLKPVSRLLQIFQVHSAVRRGDGRETGHVRALPRAAVLSQRQSCERNQAQKQEQNNIEIVCHPVRRLSGFLRIRLYSLS